MKKKLSDTASDMLLGGKRFDTIKNKDEIKKIFTNQGIPLFDKVIDFQVLYGGISYKIGERFYEGFEMNIIGFYKGEYYYHLIKEDEKYYFNCMDYHYAGDYGPFIDEEGKIYDFCMGSFCLHADSIEEFLEDESIKYYMTKKHSKWLKRGIEMCQFEVLKKENDIIKIEKEAFSNKFFEWWCNDEETIFIRINISREIFSSEDLPRDIITAQIYCKNQKVLDRLYKSKKVSACIYPND